MKRHCFTSYPLFALIGLILSPLAVVHAAPSPADSVHFCAPFDYEQWRRDHPRPAAKRLSDLNEGQPRTVRMIYFLPKGLAYRASVVEKMKDEIINVQTFFAEQMQAHGQGETTFRIETDAQGEPLVHQVDGRHPLSHYLESSTANRVIDEIDSVFDIEANIYLILIDNRGGSINAGDVFAGGLGSRWTKNGGFALVPNEATRKVISHELGHAFGLLHDFRDDTYVMSYGIDPVLSNRQLSDCHAKFLAVHTYFNPNSPIGQGSWPTIDELTSLRINTAGVKSVPVRTQIRDSDGVHQVILFTQTKVNCWAKGHYEVKSCRRLEGKTDPVVEFDYDGVIPSLIESDFNSFKTKQLLVNAVDTSGNMAFSEVFELINNRIREPITTFFSTSDSRIHSMFFLPDGRLLAVESSDDTFTLRDVSTGNAIATLPPRGPVEVVAFSPDGRLLAVESSDGTIEIWDVSSGERLVATVAAHEKDEDWSIGASSLSFSPDGKLLASGGRLDYLVKLWDVSSGELVTTIDVHEGPYGGSILSLVFSPDSRLLASASAGTVRLWDVSSGELVATVDAHDKSDWRGLSFSLDGKMLASGGARGGQWLSDTETSPETTEVKLWDVSTGKSIKPIATLLGSAPVSFSANGRLLASGSALERRWVDVDGLPGGTRQGSDLGGRTVRIWDVSTGTPIATLPPHFPSLAVAFSPDGKLLADRTSGQVKVWDVSEWMVSSKPEIVAVETDPPEAEDGEIADDEPSGEDEQGSEEKPTATVALEGIYSSHDSVSEDDGQATTITVTVTLDKAAAANVEITLAIVSPTEGKTAKRGEDFDATLDPTLTIAKGQRTGTAQLTLTPKDNTTADGDKAFGVQATSSSGHSALINIKIIDNDSAGEPQAWLMPDPAEVEFYADDPAWKTFTVHTNLDSVLVRANPSGSDPAIEVAGGQQVPTTAYCPAEGNDRPTRGLRDGWSLHVKACQAGQTKILLIDYDTDAVLQQYEVNVEAYQSTSATATLNPSYPNPFNSETILSYTLPTASAIRLEVFTLNGQRVAILHEGFQVAGYHTISIDASDLASGVYLYRLTTPEGRFAQKFTLLR